VPKINVYLPDELAAAVKDANVPVSAICQAALERAVREVTALREAAPAAHLDHQAWAAGTGIAFARHTNRARQAVALGRQAAVRLGHTYLGTEHLLLGVLEEGSNLAVRVLQALDVAPEDVEVELRGYLKPGEPQASDTPLTPTLRTALELATQEGAKLGHNYIGCEHLLLGLIAESEGLAGSLCWAWT
jgi:ATP-dependent Clp protease ATP-binding subunit ClpC